MCRNNVFELHSFHVQYCFTVAHCNSFDIGCVHTRVAQNSVESLNESCCYVKLCYIQTTCYFVFESVNDVCVVVNEHDCLRWQI